MHQFESYPLTELPEYRISAMEQAGTPLVLASLAAAVSFGHGIYRRQRLSLALAAIFASLAGALLWIYRNPDRQPPQEQGLVLAPCDGRVISVTNMAERRYVNNAVYCVQIAVGATDVQVNRAPMGGTIGFRRYEAARLATGSTQTDSNWLGVEDPGQTRVMLRQIASPGWQAVPWQLARRIICWPDLGDTVRPGQVIGHLPLGGQVELYLPATFRVKVRAGQAIRAAETVIAQL